MNEESSPQRKKMLVVEDDAVFCAILREILVDTLPQTEVLETCNGSDALKAIRIHKPVMVFMDIRLPDINGLQLTKTIKSSHPDMVVVVVTNYDTPEYRAAADEAGADGFLSKNASVMSEIQTMVHATVGAPK